MDNQVFHIKLRDSRPPIETVLWRGTSATPVSLVGVTGVKLVIADRRGGTPSEYDGEVVNASAGTVRYEWTGDEFDEPGVYYAEWQVTYSDGSIATFPNDKEFIIQVRTDLNPPA